MGGSAGQGHSVNRVEERWESRGAQETQERPFGIDDAGGHPTGRLRTSRGAITEMRIGLFGLRQAQGRMRANEVVVHAPHREELMKMVRRTGEGLGFASEGGKISAHGFVKTLDAGRIGDACEAEFLKAFLDIG